MKALKISLLSFLFGGLLTFSGCKDPCKDVVCENDGVCLEGICECATGFEGDNCETESRTKFIRTDAPVSETCGGSAFTYVTTISAGTGVTDIKIKNLGNYGCTTGDYLVNATVSGNTLTIPSQTVCATTFSGDGSIDSDGDITINYSATYDPGTGTVTDNCTATVD